MTDDYVEAQTGEEYLDAPAHTNNTGEMSAMYYALRRASHRKQNVGREIIHTDSLYAMNMATGKWMPSRKHRNAKMVARLRREWRRVQQRRPGEVRIQHVRSHIKVPGNELADWLADRGAKGAATTTGEATTWIQSWLRHQGMQRAENARAPDHGGQHDLDGLGDPHGEG